MSDHASRLAEFLTKHHQAPNFAQLTADASTREYFRVNWNGSSAIACVYGEGFVAAEHNYLDVTKLFLSAKLPVAEILATDESLGVIVLEDMGDRILRDMLADLRPTERDEMISAAISMIAAIQAATPLAYEFNSVASRLRFDREKLLWELEFFKTHYFITYRHQPLDDEDDRLISADFEELAETLDRRASVLCHRDFHAANLMVDGEGKLRIIDHQDARIGSPSYDLVSLLLDRVTEVPAPIWLADKRSELLRGRERLGLEHLDESDFAEEFRLQTIQRCLKAIGTFAFQSVNRGKGYFVPFIEPMFEITLDAADALNRFPHLRRIISARNVC